MGTPVQMYQLKWNNHRWNLTNVFEQLLQLGAFTDVTVSCEDGSLKCHKMVLAACSPYFERVLSDEAVSLYGAHAIIVLQDTPCDVFRALLEFMYKGEVNIYQEELPLLMSIAASLQIRGLYEDADEKRTAPRQRPRSPSSPGSEAVDLSRSNSSGERTFPVSLSTSVVVHKRDQPHSAEPSSTNNISGVLKRNSFAPFFHSTPTQSQLLPCTSSPSGRPPSHHAATAAAISRFSAAHPHISVSAQNNNTTPILRGALGTSLRGIPSSLVATAMPSSSSDPEDEHDDKPSVICAPIIRPHNLPQDEDAESRRHKRLIPRDHRDPLLAQSLNPVAALQRYSTVLSATDNTADLKPAFPGTEASLRISSTAGIPDVKTPSGAGGSGPGSREWKRYKLYNREDLHNAIEQVKSGVSAASAAKLFGIPSRTLYAKIKKLGIPTAPRKSFGRMVLNAQQYAGMKAEGVMRGDVGDGMRHMFAAPGAIKAEDEDHVTTSSNDVPMDTEDLLSRGTSSTAGEGEQEGSVAEEFSFRIRLPSGGQSSSQDRNHKEGSGGEEEEGEDEQPHSSSP
ncbi:unnamed protein product [Cyprideis torosa]|uniref:Uncharacterized protein n=1 Tax=Cyprideis torosa TaxID=163714 RepID=A0A7R8W287_9CRUS|nr:unnamed protein product [Cyprideis torosa]CAG0880707.1 unnamed protein product [Cyprideis torosa]